MKIKMQFEENAWCECCGPMAVGRSARGEPAKAWVGFDGGTYWCPDCVHANGNEPVYPEGEEPQ